MKSWVVKNEALGFPFESSIDIKKIQWLSSGRYKNKIKYKWVPVMSAERSRFLLAKYHC